MAEKGEEAAAVPRPSTAPVGNASGSNNAANVDIYVRIRPVAKPSSRLVAEQSENKVEFNIPHQAAHGYVNNQRENYSFRFNGVIGPEAKQDEVRGARLRASGERPRGPACRCARGCWLLLLLLLLGTHRCCCCCCY